MPRNKRIIIVGGIYHVIVRGIERRLLFKDIKDRKEFLRRFEISLEKTKSKCYAWVLMSNHVHLMIQTGKRSLTDVMRGLLTGYAIYFNGRHKRRGYLYQNRYKSVLCQKDSYFKELIRYIHLNPLRAKIVSNVEQLDSYSWSGHSVVMGNKKCDWQEINEILLWFGSSKKEAVKKYRKFISDGVSDTNSIDFSGGGVLRSIGGWSELINAKRKKEYWRGDERILGDSDFVGDVLCEAKENMDKRSKLQREGWNLERISERICVLLNIKGSDLKRKGRSNLISEAKGLVCYFSSKELGISAVEIGRFLGISQPAVSKNIIKGEMVTVNRGIKLLS
ncbi:MAG: transposase [Candidatus Omnitrophota bacterium]